MIVSNLCYDRLLRHMVEDEVNQEAQAAFDHAMANDYPGQMERNGYVLMAHARPMKNEKTPHSQL